MPYNRSKGRTHEIPPSPSPGPSVHGQSKSSASLAALAATESHPFDPRQVDAHLEAQLARHQDKPSWRRLLDRFVAVLALLGGFLILPFYRTGLAVVCFYQRTPAVVPAVTAMVFLYVGMPLLVAKGIL